MEATPDLEAGNETPEAIDCLTKFVGIVLEHFPNDKWIFRGQGELTAQLLPSAGREKYFLSEIDHGKDADLVRFERWCHQGIAFSTDLPDSPLERLAYAQHHGLATRLLDWTLNAAVALFFATEKYEYKLNGGVYAYPRPDKTEEARDTDEIGRCEKIRIYQPRPITRRIIAQDGMFTIHPGANAPIISKPFSNRSARVRRDDKALVMCIPGDRKRELQEQLRAIGFHRRTLFPDIDGLSESINCVTKWMADPRRCK